MGAARFGGGGGGFGRQPKYTCIFFSLEDDNDLESKDEIDSDSTDLTDDDSDEATDTAVDTDDADTEDSGKKIFRMHRVILLLPFRPHIGNYKTVYFLDFGFQAVDSGFQPSTDLCQRNLDSIRYWDSGFLKQHSGAQSLAFRISQAKISKIRESRFQYMEPSVFFH